MSQDTSVSLNKQKGVQKQRKPEKLGCDIIDWLTRSVPRCEFVLILQVAHFPVKRSGLQIALACIQPHGHLFCWSSFITIRAMPKSTLALKRIRSVFLFFLKLNTSTEPSFVSRLYLVYVRLFHVICRNRIYMAPRNYSKFGKKKTKEPASKGDCLPLKFRLCDWRLHFNLNEMRP